MKSIAVIFVILSVISTCYGYSQPIIPNTKAEGCFDGSCGPHCAWDGAQLFPNDNLNQPGKCRMLRCSSNYDILITPCPFDMSEIL